jgi:hypothetical protein
MLFVLAAAAAAGWLALWAVLGYPATLLDLAARGWFR